MQYSIVDAEIADYQKDGVICLRRAFDEHWLGDDAIFATRPWLTSPPFTDLTLEPGQPMHDPLFPLVETS